MEIRLIRSIGHLDIVQKLSKLSKMGNLRKPNKIGEFGIFSSWHIYCSDTELESEPSRIPVVISGLWR